MKKFQELGKGIGIQEKISRKKKIEVRDELIEVQELTVKMDDKEKTVFIETGEFPYLPGYCFYHKKGTLSIYYFLININKPCLSLYLKIFYF